MANPPPYPDTGDDTSAGPDSGPAASKSRRAYVYWIIGIVLVLLVLVLHLTGALGPWHQRLARRRKTSIGARR